MNLSPVADMPKLNGEQQKTVNHFGSPLLILAGAGSGKTRVITAKISHVIAEHSISASAIVALTFTNKAANEMRERAQSINSAAVGATICTFHSFGARFLRRYGGAGNVVPNFTIYDDSDSLSLLKSIFPNDTKAHLSQMMNRIADSKHHGLVPADVSEAYGNGQKIAEYYHAYQQRLDEIGNVDFGDLILKPLSILRNNVEIREAEQRRIKVLLIDEYQDTNHAQYQLVQQLYHESMYLCAVGDDDQSIYAFRGSDVTHIVNFPRYFSDTTVMQLLQNYRSTQPILSLASHIISNNQQRHQKTLYTKEPGGSRPRIVQLNDDYQEASFIAEEITSHNTNSTGEIAVVYRTNAQSRIFESEFNRRDIPYRVVGGMRFYAREEVKDLLAYLKLIVNTQDEVSLRRIINKPARGIGPATVLKVVTETTEAGSNFLTTLTDNIDNIAKNGSAAYRGCEQVGRLIKYGRKLITQTDDVQQNTGSEMLSIADLLHRISEESGLAEHYRAIDLETSSSKSDNIAEFIASANYYPATSAGLTEFLEQAELQNERENPDAEEKNAHVTLITMHNTKGLEFDTVYIVGLQDGLFPRTTDLDREKMEEERRLFYVAITRAKARLTLTTYETRHQYGRVISLPASRFLTEIDEDLVDRDNLSKRTTSLNAWASRSTSGRTSTNYSAIDRKQQQPWRNFNVGNPPTRTADTPSDAVARFEIGMQVFHDDYGAGEIQSRKQDGVQHILGVQFENGKLAHFIEKYASLEKIAVDR